MLQSMGSQRVGHGSVTQQQEYNNFNLSCVGVPGGAYCWGISSGQLGMDRLTEDKAVLPSKLPSWSLQPGLAQVMLLRQVAPTLRLRNPFSTEEQMEVPLSPG